MKYFISLCFAFIVCSSYAQNDSVPTLKTILLEQLKTTHNVKDWFVPPSIAIAGLTADAGKLERQYRKSFHCTVNHSSYFLEPANAR